MTSGWRTSARSGHRVAPDGRCDLRTQRHGAKQLRCFGRGSDRIANEHQLACAWPWNNFNNPINASPLRQRLCYTSTCQRHDIDPFAYLRDALDAWPPANSATTNPPNCCPTAGRRHPSPPYLPLADSSPARLGEVPQGPLGASGRHRKYSSAVENEHWPKSRCNSEVVDHIRLGQGRPWPNLLETRILVRFLSFQYSRFTPSTCSSLAEQRTAECSRSPRLSRARLPAAMRRCRAHPCPNHAAGRTSRAALAVRG